MAWREHDGSGDCASASELFLLRAGLITITPVSSSLENNPNYYQDLWAGNGRFHYKDELFRTYNICIRYPMFYVEILKDILGKSMPENFPSALLGSIVECHVRGILSSKNCFTYHDTEGRKIDYVNVLDQEAIEITVSDKRMRQLHFECVPGGAEAPPGMDAGPFTGPSGRNGPWCCAPRSPAGGFLHSRSFRRHAWRSEGYGGFPGRCRHSPVPGLCPRRGGSSRS